MNTSQSIIQQMQRFLAQTGKRQRQLAGRELMAAPGEIVTLSCGRAYEVSKSGAWKKRAT